MINTSFLFLLLTLLGSRHGEEGALDARQGCVCRTLREAGRDHDNADLTLLELRILHHAPNNLGALIDGLADNLRSLVYLQDAQIVGVSDDPKNALGARDRNIE